MKTAAYLAVLWLATPMAAQYTLALDETVVVPETGALEYYHLALPASPPSSMPLIVAFHGLYQLNHDVLVFEAQDSTNNWDLLTDATNQGFAVLMPKAGVPYNPPNDTVVTYGSQDMHYHVAAAIDDVLNSNSNIDQDRIYGYGFSMGGDDALSYAARHLDPTKPMFAAVITHSGAVSPPWAYNMGFSQALYETLYMATSYAADELLFQQATTVDYDVVPPAGIRPDTSMAWNLSHIPVRSYYDSNGVLPEDGARLRAQNVELTALMSSIGHADFVAANTDNGEGHGYDRLLTSTILSHFSGSLEIPREGTVLLAEPLDPTAADERVFHFRVTRRATGQAPLMASFEWDSDHDLPGGLSPYPARLDLHALERIDTIRCLTKKLGYNPTKRLNINVTIADGSPITLELAAYNSLPNKIKANGSLLATTDYGLTGSVLWINVQSNSLLEIFP